MPQYVMRLILAVVLVALEACFGRPPGTITDVSEVMMASPWCLPLVLNSKNDERVPSRFCVPTLDQCLAARKFARAHSGLLRVRDLGDCIEE